MAGPSYRTNRFARTIICRIYLLLSVLYKAGKQNPGAKDRHISWRFFKPEHVLCFCARLFGGVNHHAVPLQLVLFLGPLLPPAEVVCELQGTLARSVVDQV